MFIQKRQLEYAVSQQHFATIEDHKEKMQTKISDTTKEIKKRKFDALLLKRD